jgi:preprotein translocase subunit SecE
MAAEGEAVSLQIMVPDQSTAIRVELGKVCWATRREFGVEFLVILDDSK